MKVNIAFETTDMEGEVSKTDQFAVMERTNDGYRLVYVEDVMNDGNKVKATMLLTNSSLRVMRSGVVNSDFMYGTAMVHNTVYETPYGKFPVTLETKAFSFEEKRESEKTFTLTTSTTYDLIFEGQEPLSMSICVTITPIETC